MSQQELADRIGVPKSTIGRIESGLTSPRVETLLKFRRH
ncbi:helix-turn-helix transcriptional regulator [Geobacillus zalihae]|nr:helix-turn-helix transcriptional regulator [Geobacillus zalihae]